MIGIRNGACNFAFGIKAASLIIQDLLLMTRWAEK
jgi:hypothetical protein